MSENTKGVYKEAKPSPYSGRLWRVMEVRTVDTHQVMGYELQIYSQHEARWFGTNFNQRPEVIVREWEQNTGEV